MASVQYLMKTSPPMRDLLGRFNKGEQVVREARRAQLKPEARRLVGLARDEAPSKSGRFRRSIGYRTFDDGKDVGFVVYAKEPLASYIQKGTKRHPIVAKSSKVLRFWWEEGPEGPGIYFFTRVNHPGTKANRFMGRAVRRWKPGARAMLRRVALYYIDSIRGK